MLLIHSDDVQQCITGEDGEIIAITTQRPPHRCQRDGMTGLLQRPIPDSLIPVDATTVIRGRVCRSVVNLPESLLSSAYGLQTIQPEYQYDPPAGIEPLPECSDDVTEYLLSFWESARKIALHPRIVDRLQKRSPWFDAEDMPQTALEYLLSDPKRYALEDSHQGARLAVRDILDDLRRGNRTLIDDVRTDRKQLPLRESIPDPKREYVDPEAEAERLISSGIVSPRSAHIAIALASDATREVVAESLGVTRQTVHNLTRKMLAEVIVRGSI